MKARVPSSGSTRKNASPVAGTRPAATASSAITGIPGAARCRPSVSTSSASWSAMVTGVVSAFVSTSTPAAKWRISMRPAASTAGSNASTSGPYSSSFICRSYPDSLAGLCAGRSAARVAAALTSQTREAHRRADLCIGCPARVSEGKNTSQAALVRSVRASQRCRDFTSRSVVRICDIIRGHRWASVPIRRTLNSLHSSPARFATT